MKYAHIITHTDLDGLGAAAIIYEYLKLVNKKINVNVTRVDYNNILNLGNIHDEDEVYFLDYSFSNPDNISALMNLLDRGIKVVWIDHHKTSEDVIYGGLGVKSLWYKDRLDENCSIINTDYSATLLAYLYALAKLLNYNDMQLFLIDHFHNLDDPKNLNIPNIIKYIDSYDTWKHYMENDIEFELGMKSNDFTVKNLFSNIFNFNSKECGKLFNPTKNTNRIINTFINKTITAGKYINKYNEVQNKQLCKNSAFEFIINDGINNKIYKCIGLNHRGNSTMFGDLINEYDIVVGFRYNDGTYNYSLYTAKDDVDISKVAKNLGTYNNLGGGGHKKAAGFVTHDQIIKKDCVIYIEKRLLSNGVKIIIA